MLRYSIRLTDNNIEKEKLVWSEKYLAPDLSFVSGVTSQDYHLEKYNRLPLTNNILSNTNSVADLETENVTRQGYIIIKGKQYTPLEGSLVDYSVESGGQTIEYKYLFLNGKYYYADENNKFHIDHWLTETFVEDEQGDIKPMIVEDDIEVDYANPLKIDTIAWIEDGMVGIDGHKYFYDKDIQLTETTSGGLKYFEDGECLDEDAITKCDSIEYHLFKSASDYIDVTKFKLTKAEEVNEVFERISFCRYFYYVKYKEHYFPIVQEFGNDNSYTFECYIPKNVLSGNSESTEEEKIKFDLYFSTEEGEVDYTKPSNKKLDSSNVSAHKVHDFTDFKNVASYIIVDNEAFFVEYDVLNANDGREIAVYLDGDATNFKVGDIIRFVDTSDPSHAEKVYSVDDYGFNRTDDTDFVIFKGKKYKLEANLCDKVLINEHEYSIDYINGKTDGKDCLVLIGDEEVPMKISTSATKLERYGKIIEDASQPAISVTYNIVSYSGITVDNKRYMVYVEGQGTDQIMYAILDGNNEYSFLVNEVIGSSMVICEPDVNKTDFTDDFNLFIAREICTDVVDNQHDMTLFVNNKIFGDKEITQELAFQAYTSATSSDDYYNLFEHLDVYTRDGYIKVPLSLEAPQGNNMIQDDLVTNRFFEEEKKKAINPIVDMEKDVYYPKYINNSDKAIEAFLKKETITPEERTTYQTVYIGSHTEFHPIKQIRVNQHFRTRSMESWKVNEGYNDVLTSGVKDNWFITDFHPYVDILQEPSKLINKETLRPYTDANIVGDILMNTSDLMWLLLFSNDDVYYQRSNIAKSFLRFSFYDSTDPQTQTLLATSCAFMDEHRLFKKYIDNSRKNVNDYGVIVEPEIEEGTDNAIGSVLNKISVRSEYLGSRHNNRGAYQRRGNPYTHFDGVIIDNEHRLGSEFIIDNKYETSDSSEGFYIYIFREYSEDLSPKPIYMKVEFNHAGIGRFIPFIIPMRWNTPNEDTGDKTPSSALTFNTQAPSENVLSDMELLKQGIKLGDVYAQTYIPLYAVYDFNNKEYAYVFDSRYVSTANSDEVSLNLFELKVQNEEIAANATDRQVEVIQRGITMKKQERAVIDINTNQFPQHDNECE